jgi:hypothetical protein
MRIPGKTSLSFLHSCVLFALFVLESRYLSSPEANVEKRVKIGIAEKDVVFFLYVGDFDAPLFAFSLL